MRVTELGKHLWKESIQFVGILMHLKASIALS